MPLRNSTRINKYISESGLCSRREADRLVEQGNVWINGRRATTGDQVAAGDRVKVNGQDIEPQQDEDLVLIALNKPVGIVSTTESSEKDNIVDFVKHATRIFPIGRLDKDSQGLILLTNHGDLVNKILRANNHHEKEYRVTVDKPITQAFIEGMQEGVPILGQVTRKCQVSKVSTFVFTITLVQGLNRQIRRMCEYFGYGVTELVRTRIMNLSLKGLALGDWRDLTVKETETLIALTEASEAAPPSGTTGSPRSTTPSSNQQKNKQQKNKQQKNKLQRPDYNGGTDRPSRKRPAKEARSREDASTARQGKPAAGKPARAQQHRRGKTSASAKPSTRSNEKGKAVSKGGVRRGKTASGKPPPRRK